LESLDLERETRRKRKPLTITTNMLLTYCRMDMRARWRA
jgi:hypothetical protein